MENTSRGSGRPGRASSERALSGDLLVAKPPLATRHEQVSLMFNDPRLSTSKELDPSQVKPCESSKRKPENIPERPEREDAKRACREEEVWAKIVTRRGTPGK
ncbi:hypothetical protein CR513_44658, partial [Mucuna pruriens]